MRSRTVLSTLRLQTESLSSTEAQNAFGAVLERVAKGVVVQITNRKKPRAVLLSIETYEQLLAERVDPLASLRVRFDERFSKMQMPAAKVGIQALFDASPNQLGIAAAKGAKKRE